MKKTFACNLDWIHPKYHLESTDSADLVELRRIASTLKEKLLVKNTTVTDITTTLDKEMNLETGTALSLFRHLLARKKVMVDMFKVKISSNLSTQAIQEVAPDDDE